jgi:DNA-binding NtrC family response regulator
VSSTRCDILLAAADWQSRALLLAELQEAGWGVVALPGLRHALRAMIGERVRPRVILLDVHGDRDATPGYAEQIAGLVPGIPLLLMVGVYDMPDWQPLRERGVEMLARPLSVAEVVEAVRPRLERTPDLLPTYRARCWVR